MKYFLIKDDCEHFHYTHNAFTLLRLPLEILSVDSLATADFSLQSVLFICPHHEEHARKTIQSALKGHKTAVISFSDESSALYKNRYHHVLHLSFSKYELKNALLCCADHQEDVPNFATIAHPAIEKLVSRGETMRQIKMMIQQVAASDATVLLLGESGTGKDIIASCIHHLSDRHEKPLVPINCGAIPNELMESELFGHEKGAFTGALARRPGRFELANEGTLFLDEIGDMPLNMQVKLLRVLQDKKIERVGGTVSIDVNVRLIAATNKNLEDLIQHHQFREDLFYRLNVFPIHVPSLRERAEDIPIIIDFYLDKIFERFHHRVSFSERAQAILCAYAWPGNIRELQNFLERMVILHPDQVIDEPHIDAMYKQRKSSSMPSLPSAETAVTV